MGFDSSVQRGSSTCTSNRCTRTLMIYQNKIFQIMINNWSRSVPQHLPTTLNPCTTTHWRFTQGASKEGEQKVQQLFFQQASFMDSTKSNKIREIVRLQQIIKKWKKLANAPKNNSNAITSSPSTTNGNKSIKFLKRTLSFSDALGASNDVVPKGFLAVCVGKELKRFIIPTEYLGHQAFGILLREAEEEFGFQQEGVLKIPCEVSVFEKILKVVEEKREVFFLHEFGYDADKEKIGCSSPDCELTSSHLPQMCR